MAGRALLHLRPAPGTSAAAADAFCARITPRWETAAGGFLLDLTGTGRLYGRGLDGLARVCREARRCFDLPAAGAGPSPLCARLAAWTAARVAPGCVLTVPAGCAAAFLARFPLEVLDTQPTAVGRLRELGVRTLGDLQVVPRPLLQAVFGPLGPALAEEACGRGAGGPGGGRTAAAPALLIVGARLGRPLDSRAAAAALRRGLAIRALTACPAGPASRRRWLLRARWPDGSRAEAALPGGGEGGWSDWQALLDGLWERLPARRRGLVGLDLLADGGPGRHPGQGRLFAADAADDRLAAALRRTRGRAGGGLGPASEALLRAWGVRWLEAQPALQAPVDAPGPDR